jgi:serine/threonine protein kinase
MNLAPGTRIGPYEIVSMLGAGGMGEVYKARDPRLGRDVAIKVLPATFAADPGARARFEREAKAIVALSHPNILAIHEFGLQDSIVFAVTELLHGVTLRDRLHDGALPRHRAIDYGVQIARGLAAAHDRGIVHRDLKPENVFVTPDGQVKILDFGLARVALTVPAAASATTVLTDHGIVLGTLGYMSPEQVRGQTADSRADLFALGAVLYEMLSGHRAFQRNTTAETMTARARDSDRHNGPPGELAHVSQSGLVTGRRNARVHEFRDHGEPVSDSGRRHRTVS